MASAVLTFITMIAICYCAILIFPVSSKPTMQSKGNNDSLELITNSNHIIRNRMQKVFGMANDRRGIRERPPPQYMLSLFMNVADQSGLVKARNPYEAKTIRSFTEKESAQENHFIFNISGNPMHEVLLEAELHLYVLKYNIEQPFVIRVYQVLADTDVRERNRLIDIRYINHSIEGWQIFRVKKAFEKGLPYSEWNDNSKTKHFLITAVNSIGFPVRFKIRRGFELDQVADYQPLLVLFNDDTSSIFAEEDTFKNKNIFPQENRNFRQRRELTKTLNNLEKTNKLPNPQSENYERRDQNESSECHREDMMVNFESVGWSEWVIAPKLFNAYQCVGLCYFPITQSQKPTNHATVQSIVAEMQLVEGVSQPCCVPNQLLSLSLLYYDENDNVVLKQYGDMVVANCGCA